MTRTGRWWGVALALSLTAAACGQGEDRLDVSGTTGDASSEITLADPEPSPHPTAAPEPTPEASPTAAPPPDDRADDLQASDLAAYVADRRADSQPPDEILIAATDLLPEGVIWHSDLEMLMVGSIAQGGVWAVTADGQALRFDTGSSNGDEAGTVGLAWDDGDGTRPSRVAAAFADLSTLSTGSAVAWLGLYDGETGEQVAYVDLAEATPSGVEVFANDVAFDPANGDAYVTNTATPLIWRVGPDGTAEVFANLPGDGSARGLNGIVVHPDGYLIVAAIQSGNLFTVALDDPTEQGRIALDEPLRFDGLHLLHRSSLLGVVQPNAGSFDDDPALVELSTRDNFRSAQVTRRADLIASATPTTLTVAEGRPFVIHSHLLDNAAGISVDEFELLHSPLEPCTGSSDWPCPD